MRLQKSPVFVLLAVSYFVYVLYGLLAEGTWDDDCIARFYATSNAFSDPTIWVSLFHRPIWVILFALPVQLGYWVVPVLMSGICMLTALALYKSVDAKDQPYSWLVIVLLLYQPFYFGVGKSALTEPLAALFIALGYWAIKEKKYHLFVICGALIPLARLELVVLLSFWAILLVRHRQWKLIPLLGSGILLWNIAGMLVYSSTDPLWLMREVLNRGTDPYGQISFFAFFNRYFYVVGPLTFILLLLGLIEGIRKKKWALFVHGQFCTALLLYSVLAAAWDTARSGAFLRHMIVLSPLAAIIAFDGFNFILSMIQKAKQRKLLISYLAFILAIYWAFFRYELKGHHSYTEDIGWVNLLVVLLVLACILWLVPFSRKTPKRRQLVVASYGMSLIAMSFTLITENPSANMNPERTALNEVRDIYQQTSLQSTKLLASHPHFLKSIDWPAQLWQTNLVTYENLLNANPGTIVVWDGHYSRPQKGGVRNTEIPALGYVELFRVIATDNSYSVIIYEKTHTSTGFDLEKRLKNLLVELPDSPHLHFGLARHQFINGNYESAQANINRAVALGSSQFVFHAMLGDLAAVKGDAQGTIRHFKKSIQLCPDQFAIHKSLGTVYYNQKQYELAIGSYTKALDIFSNDGITYFKRGLAFRALSQEGAACEDWKRGTMLGHGEAKKYYGLYCGGE